MTLTDVFSLRDADVDGVMAKHGPGVTDGAPSKSNRGLGIQRW